MFIVIDNYFSFYFNKYKEKLVILQSIGIIKSKETRPTPADGYLISIIQLVLGNS